MFMDMTTAVSEFIMDVWVYEADLNNVLKSMKTVQLETISIEEQLNIVNAYMEEFKEIHYRNIQNGK